MAKLKHGKTYNLDGPDMVALSGHQCFNCNNELSFEHVDDYNMELIAHTYVAYCSCGKATYLKTSNKVKCEVYNETEEK